MKIAYEPWFPPEFKSGVDEALIKFNLVCPAWLNHLTVSWADDGEYVAQMSVQEEYRAATLTLGKSWATASTNHDRDHIILHELCHLYTAPISRTAREAVANFQQEETPGTRIASDAIVQSMERSTEDMAILLHRLFRLMWGTGADNEPA